MPGIREFMTCDHRACDDLFAGIEAAVVGADWPGAKAALKNFTTAMLRHFGAEEEILFPAFEEKTGMRMGPTQVMRSEHLQIRDLLAEMEAALARQDGEEYSGAAETLLIMMQQHNMKEENILYPMCDQHLEAGAIGVLAQVSERVGRAPA
ncbi:MAG: hemerythrin domain-containing protein [Betaproteobacteria bacterium]|nr:hemerythrin domain-containing protein [Betaproteobacteria bacterium]